MQLKKDFINIAWISAGYILAGFFVTQLIVPLQNEFLPNITNFAALIYPIHGIRVSYCQIWCLRLVGHAAIWSGFVASIPSLNVTPVITLAR